MSKDLTYGLNTDMPIDVFAKLCAKEVIFLRTKVAELTAENKALHEALNSAQKNSREALDSAQKNSMADAEQIKECKKQLKVLRKHIASMMVSLLDVTVEGSPCKIEQVINLAYLAGFSDKNFIPAHSVKTLKQFLKETTDED